MDIPAAFVEATDSGPSIIGIVINLALGALAAAYGIWLLHHHRHQPAHNSGDEDHMSPPQQPSAA